MAAALVFRTPELLEAVLLQLSQRDLLLLQRVCCCWRDTVTNSPVLQQKLFFQAVSHTAEPELNPLLREFFSPFFVVEEVPDSSVNGRRFESAIEITTSDWYKDVSRREKVMREEATWRRMFPIQPQARIEKVVRKGGCRCVGNERRTGWVRGEFWDQEKENGVRMGGLWDLVMHVLDTEPLGEFFVEWMMFPVVIKVGDDEWDDPEYEGEIDPIWYDGRGWKDGAAGWKHTEIVPAQRNAITIHNDHSRECFPGSPVPCGLSIIGFAENMIVYENDGKER